MKKKILSVILTMCMMTSLVPTGITASTLPEAPAECSCTEKCTEGEMNVDCPVCSAEGADLSACLGEEKAKPKAPIVAAPSTKPVPEDELSSMPSEAPSESPSETPSEIPSQVPSESPSETPSEEPSPAVLSEAGEAFAKAVNELNSDEYKKSASDYMAMCLPESGASPADIDKFGEEINRIMAELSALSSDYEALSEGDKVLLTAEKEKLDALVQSLNDIMYSTEELATGAFTVQNGTEGEDYSYDSATGALTILKSTALAISNTNSGNATTDHIVVAENVEANITLNNVNIDLSGVSDTAKSCPVDLSSAGVSTITLSGSSTLKAGTDRPGIYVPNGNKLTITGSGSLDTTGATYWPGIGRDGNCNILINSGEITAQGGQYGAAIGGSTGTQNFHGKIEIKGGTIIAVSDFGYGIGAGGSNTQGSVIISGGNIATSGISGGSQGTVNITGGKFGDGVVADNTVYNVEAAEGYAVVATDDETYPFEVLDEKIVNSDLKVTATDPSKPLSYGTDYEFDADGNLTIKSDKPMTIANKTPATATTDHIVVAEDVAADITLNGVNIAGTNDTSFMPFSISSGATANVTIQSENTLVGSNSTAGLSVPNGTALIITDKSSGTLNVTGGNNGSGIGGNDRNANGNITINGGTINVTGGSNGAAIGTGNSAYPRDKITINSGTVNAVPGAGGAGIGGGAYTNGCNVEITGGNVKISQPSSGALAIGHGGSVYTYSATIITGGKFGNGDADTGKVYGIAPDISYRVQANTDADNAEYPVKVISNEGLTDFDIVAKDPEASVEFRKDYTITSKGNLYILSGKPMIISNKSGVPTIDDFIHVRYSGKADITLNGVNINISDDIGAPLSVSGEELKLTLAEGSENSFVCSEDAGISVSSGATLTIDGTGKLNAIGGDGYAGIGGNTVGTINIKGGDITADIDGENGTGIGSGPIRTSIPTQIVNISGGKVTAIGHGSGVGIGTLTDSTYLVDVNISGGNITV